jgi:hypothetical protein
MRLLELEKKMASMKKNLQTTGKTVKRIDNNSILLINKVEDIDKTNFKLVKLVEEMGNHFKRFMDDFAESKGPSPDRTRKKPIQSEDLATHQTRKRSGPQLNTLFGAKERMPWW